jgi:hypothetical protein
VSVQNQQSIQEPQERLERRTLRRTGILLEARVLCLAAMWRCQINQVKGTYTGDFLETKEISWGSQKV